MNTEYDSLSQEEWLKKLVRLACSYKQQFGRSLAITGDLGELYACSVLGLDRASAGTKGHDATDPEHKLVQIKSRAPSSGKGNVNPSGRVGRFTNFDFDYALLVLLTGDYKVEGIWQADPPSLKAAQEAVNNPRAGIHVRTFQNVGGASLRTLGWLHGTPAKSPLAGGL